MIHDLPTAERPREKLVALGVKALSNAELLSILISSGSANDSAISLASKVLALERDGLAKLSTYEPEEFMKVKGIGIAKACSLVAAIELGRRIQTSPVSEKVEIRDSDSVARLFLEEMRYLPKEVLKIIMLDSHMKIIGKSDISTGGITDASAHPREVFAPAIKKGAAYIIIAHNHPSGDCKASNADIQTTKVLAESGKLLGISLQDHIIIGDGSYTSVREICPDLF